MRTLFSYTKQICELRHCKRCLFYIQLCFIQKL
ncbi:hypothetical protein FC826_04330 [Clostridium botulinum]|uniref:Uncharacterized protein n=1 Tax=Clostridium botulinum TaxID=1491 RepID=A0A6B4DFR3_CLOBO|nr:hypothetical protein DB732_11765 [Clostridium botulinum]NFK35030.1 hypothetical protein [Clostridium botulinum H04402 065]AWB32312.1 hypothetical protein DBN47_11760 [Clostridium botulinum]EGT5616070.1 hypothetical protein [Clostridium botulinum]EGT5623485.1 hypothetical protein [Clostridium botulinum]